MKHSIGSGKIEHENDENRGESMGTILLIVLILLLVGALPRWGYNRNWGYQPSGLLSLVLVVVLVCVLLEYIPYNRF